jgi:hypothetical protein
MTDTKTVIATMLETMRSRGYPEHVIEDMFEVPTETTDMEATEGDQTNNNEPVET